MSTRARAATLIVCGAVVAAALALASGASARDAVGVVALAAGGSLAAAIAGAALLRTLRRRSLRVQVLAVALATTLTMVVGVLLAAEFMLVSSHDLTVLAVVLVVAGSVAGGAALYLGDMYERDTRDVEVLAARLAEPGAAGDGAPSSHFATRDIQRLADQLAEVSATLEASRRRERAIDASRRQLLVWISHDLRSPIAAIRALAEALDDGVVADPDDVDRYHRAIVHESQRLGSLVDDLFELSRLVSGDEPLDQPFVPVPELVSAVVAGLTPSAAVSGVTVHATVEELSSVLVPANDVSRVLRNLLDNAVRHTPAGGEVTLDVRRADKLLELSVSDECGGISSADLGRVFDVAFRGDDARTRDGGGGGLGLAIAKGLVEGRAGTIEVSNRSRGCRFTVHLPVVDL
jgi:signal transduction histidine kinase